MNSLYVVGFAGGESGMEVHNCSKCGQQLRGDHGYKLNDGSYACRAGDKCSMRKNSKNDNPMRWRK